MDQFQDITSRMHEIYVKKNADYGSSFDEQFDEYGMTSAVIRLSDKLKRLKQLTKTGTANVKDESMEDTLMDLANYSILAIMQLRKRRLLGEAGTENPTPKPDTPLFDAGYCQSYTYPPDPDAGEPVEDPAPIEDPSPEPTTTPPPMCGTKNSKEDKIVKEIFPGCTITKLPDEEAEKIIQELEGLLPLLFAH